jgi:putative copper export protein
MNPTTLVPALVLFLHDLFTVVWIGGILFMALVLTPALRSGRGAGAAAPGLAGAAAPGLAGAAGPGAGPAAAGEGPLAAFAKRVQARQAPFVIASILGLAVTGVLLARVNGAGGIFRFDTPYNAVLSVKHVLVIALVALSVVRRRVVSVPAATGGRAPSALLAASAVTGVVILALSALNAAMR